MEVSFFVFLFLWHFLTEYKESYIILTKWHFFPETGILTLKSKGSALHEVFE